jgi:hypothetical protein
MYIEMSGREMSEGARLLQKFNARFIAQQITISVSIRRACEADGTNIVAIAS